MALSNTRRGQLPHSAGAGLSTTAVMGITMASESAVGHRQGLGSGAGTRRLCPPRTVEPPTSFLGPPPFLWGAP